MSTSMFNSARLSAAATFNTVGTAAHLINDSLNAASLGMDMLTANLKTAHSAATQNLEDKIAVAKAKDLSLMEQEFGSFLQEQASKYEGDDNAQHYLGAAITQIAEMRAARKDK